MKRKKKKNGGAFGKKGGSKIAYDELIRKTIYAFWCYELIGERQEAIKMIEHMKAGFAKTGHTFELKWNGRILDYVIRRRDGSTWFTGTFEEAVPGSPEWGFKTRGKIVAWGIMSPEGEEGLN